MTNSGSYDSFILISCSDGLCQLDSFFFLAQLLALNLTLRNSAHLKPAYNAFIKTGGNLLPKWRSVGLFPVRHHGHFCFTIVICNFIGKVHQINAFKMMTEFFSCLLLCEYTVKWHSHEL